MFRMPSSLDRSQLYTDASICYENWIPCAVEQKHFLPVFLGKHMSALRSSAEARIIETYKIFSSKSKINLTVHPEAQLTKKKKKEKDFLGTSVYSEIIHLLLEVSLGLVHLTLASCIGSFASSKFLEERLD